MAESREVAEQVVDEVWSLALSKIMKGQSETGSPRPILGSDISLFVPQVAVATLMSANPAFAGVLYSSAYTAAQRNAYIIIRRLGMPKDFFWKFDYWTKERAFETLERVISRIFGAIMTRHKEGSLQLGDVDVEKARFDLRFGSCAECAGLNTSSTMCFFHAGVFAGVLAALLDREFDALETECVAKGDKECRFLVGPRDDREIKRGIDERLRVSVKVDVSQRLSRSFGGAALRGDLGDLVDVGYYQLLIASSFLTNVNVLATACFEIGEELGRTVAPVVRQRYQGTAASIIGQFYRELRYLDVNLVPLGRDVEVRGVEAPEAMGPLAQTTFVPFLCGELQSLLSELSGAPIVLTSTQVSGDGSLLLRFSPQTAGR